MGLDNNRIYAAFDGRNKTSLMVLAEDLLARQRGAWEQLAAGYAALDQRCERRLTAGDLTVVLQHNPRRIVSTSANIDPDAIRQRPCFLCPDNLPAAQQAIVYRRRFLVLCNPFPIVPQHFTIAHRDHLPQGLSGVIAVCLQLARDVQPDYTVLYNGPQSGASAPDHLHFQALPREFIPALNEGRERLMSLRERQGLALYKKRDGARTAWWIEGENAKEIEALIRSLLQAMQRVSSRAGRDDEPMLNLFCLHEEGRWRVIIYPRRLHRPTAYYKTGAEQIMVSPGAVDMGGVLVLPRKEDYERLDAALLTEIFQEVSLEERLLDEIAAKL